MEFSVNHPLIFVIVGIIVAFVLGQSVFFLVRALKRAKELGIAKETVTKTISSNFHHCACRCNFSWRSCAFKKPWRCASLASPFGNRLAFL